MLLEARGVSASYGTAPALKGVTVTIDEGEVVALIGANGAGKSTLLRTLSGLLPPTAGQITFAGRRVDGRPPHKIVRLGMVHVPEGRLVFGPMSVLDNMKMGAYLRKDRKEIRADLERMFEHFPILRARSAQLASTLSGGEQQMLAVARALMTAPRLMLMDEPSMGLSPKLVEAIGDIVATLRSSGVSSSAGGAERRHGARRFGPGVRARDRLRRPRGRRSFGGTEQRRAECLPRVLAEIRT